MLKFSTINNSGRRCGNYICSACSCEAKEECDTGTKDTKSKEYLSNNERFADLCNVVLFDGEQVIRADSLQERDAVEVLSIFGEGNEEAQFQKWRDLLKSATVKLAGDVCIVLIGVENQSDVHYAMPVRNMLYDAVNYGAQIKEVARKHKEKRDKSTGAEFLSGFYKADRLIPVITITVYWGAEEWDAPRNLYEMFGQIDEGLKKFVSDYSINVVIPREIKDFRKFRTPLGAVLEIIRVSEDEEEMERLLKTRQRYSRMDNESVAVINTFTGIGISLDMEKGETDMCKAWADHKEAGRKEERFKTAKRMLRRGKLTYEEIAEDVELSLEQVEALAKEVESEPQVV